MIKLVALYGQPTDPTAFERHYLGTHYPLSTKVAGIKRVEMARVVGTMDGSAPPFYRVANVYFDDMEQMQASMRSAEGQALTADGANFVTGGVTVLVCEVDDEPTSLFR
jgi:uncharacterized protein (TIGR02118 family)